MKVKQRRHASADDCDPSAPESNAAPAFHAWHVRALQHAHKREMHLVTHEAAAAAADSKAWHRSHDPIAASASPPQSSPSQSQRTVKSSHQQRDRKVNGALHLQQPPAAHKKPGSRSGCRDSAAARDRVHSGTSSGRISSADGSHGPRHSSSGTSASANASSLTGAARSVRLPCRHTAKRQQHASSAAAMPADAADSKAGSRLNVEQQRPAGTVTSGRAEAPQDGRSEEPAQYLLTMHAAFDEGDGRPGSARGVFSGTVTQVAGSDTPFAALKMTGSASTANNVPLPAAWDPAASSPDANTVSASGAGLDMAPAPAGATPIKSAGFPSALINGGEEAAALVSWRENPTARRTRESSFYSVQSQSDPSDGDDSGKGRTENIISGNSSTETGGDSGGGAGDVGGWRSNAVATAGAWPRDDATPQAGGDVPHLLDVDYAAGAAILAARAAADGSSSFHSSDGGRGSSSGSCGNDDGSRPLIQLAHADSGRLRTATVDSECPTGLEAAAAAETSSDVAWPHPLQQQRAPAEQVMPMQQQPLHCAESGRLRTATVDSACPTGLLFVPAAPERISEVGDGSMQPDFNTIHPAANAAQAAAPFGHTTKMQPAIGAAAAPAVHPAAVGQPAAHSVASALGGRARSAASPRRLQRRKPAFKQRRHLVRRLSPAAGKRRRTSDSDGGATKAAVSRRCATKSAAQPAAAPTIIAGGRGGALPNPAAHAQHRQRPASAAQQAAATAQAARVSKTAHAAWITSPALAVAAQHWQRPASAAQQSEAPQPSTRFTRSAEAADEPVDGSPAAHPFVSLQRPKSRHGRAAPQPPQQHPEAAACRCCGSAMQRPAIAGAGDDSSSSGSEDGSDEAPCGGDERRLVSFDGGCSSIFAGSTPLDLLPLPSEGAARQPRLQTAELAAALADSETALAASHAAAAELQADLRAVRGGGAALRRQLAEAEAALIEVHASAMAAARAAAASESALQRQTEFARQQEAAEAAAGEACGHCAAARAHAAYLEALLLQCDRQRLRSAGSSVSRGSACISAKVAAAVAQQLAALPGPLSGAEAAKAKQAAKQAEQRVQIAEAEAKAARREAEEAVQEAAKLEGMAARSIKEAQATVEELRVDAESQRSRAIAAEAAARQLQADAARTAAKHAAQLKRHQQEEHRLGREAREAAEAEEAARSAAAAANAEAQQCLELAERAAQQLRAERDVWMAARDAYVERCLVTRTSADAQAAMAEAFFRWRCAAVSTARHAAQQAAAAAAQQRDQAQAQLVAASAAGASLATQASAAALRALSQWLLRRQRRLRVDRAWLAWRLQAAGGTKSHTGRVPSSVTAQQRVGSKRADIAGVRPPAAMSARGAWAALQPGARTGTLDRAAAARASADGGGGTAAGAATSAAAAAAAAATVAAAMHRRRPKASAPASKAATSSGYGGGLCGDGSPQPCRLHTIIARQYCYDPPVLVGDAEARQRARRRDNTLQHGHMAAPPAGDADGFTPPVVAGRRRHSSPGGRLGSSAGELSVASGAAVAATMPFYPSIPAAARLSAAVSATQPKAAGPTGSAAAAAARVAIGPAQADTGAGHAMAPRSNQRHDQAAVGINACPVADTCCSTAVEPVPRRRQGMVFATGTVDVTGCLHVDVLDDPGHVMRAANMGPDGGAVATLAPPQAGTKFVCID